MFAWLIVLLYNYIWWLLKIVIITSWIKTFKSDNQSYYIIGSWMSWSFHFVHIWQNTELNIETNIKKRLSYGSQYQLIGLIVMFFQDSRKKATSHVY